MKRIAFFICGSKVLAARFIALVAVVCVSIVGYGQLSSSAIINSIRNSAATAVLADGSTSNAIKITRTWQGNNCQTTIANTGNSAVKVKEIVLFSANRLFAPTTPFYAEAFQMLAQNIGTLGNPQDLGEYTDRNHYKLEEPPGYRVVYNVIKLSPAENEQYLLGFSSCNRYVGKFYLSADTVKVVMDLENLEMPAGATWKLEDFYMQQADNRNTLFNNFSAAIEKNHPRLKSTLPTGWCSWYCFGPEVTAKNIYDNLAAIKKEIPKLKYIQLDDGYQVDMGDWLTIGKSFGGGIKEVLHKIKQEGFEPAIWVAPFICDSNSSVYKEHKDWLLKDENGNPLRSDKVGFGGWRLAPWYVLDGTNPAVQKHLEEVFSTMRKEWGCTYFKLDANYWGAIHKAKYYKKDATRTEAYREGMKAILKGAGDAFILGCNHPEWPSLGLIHGSRSSMDISRDWESISHTGRENLYRSWENGKLWWNDPDCLVLTGNLPDNVFMFHTALLYATGGMVLSGDDVPAIPANRLGILQKMANATGVTAQFNADTFDYGWVKDGKQKKLVVLNWDDKLKTFNIAINHPCTLTNYFTGEKIGSFDKEIVLKDFTGQNGAVYVVEEK